MNFPHVTSAMLTLNKSLSNTCDGLSSMEFTMLSDNIAAGGRESSHLNVIQLVRVRTGLGLHAAKALVASVLAHAGL